VHAHGRKRVSAPLNSPPCRRKKRPHEDGRTGGSLIEMSFG
jgi:hypothetical protein